ncbi:hypothetical protein BOO92_21670 [Vibrio navarrensis]|nr:hypothetical protein [Vibrio navarrensis]MBE3659262.1 hypothetical protein [Vibrio navarrensis]
MSAAQTNFQQTTFTTKITAYQKCHAARIPLERFVMFKLQGLTFTKTKINSALTDKQKAKPKN